MQSLYHTDTSAENIYVYIFTVTNIYSGPKTTIPVLLAITCLNIMLHPVNQINGATVIFAIPWKKKEEEEEKEEERGGGRRGGEEEEEEDIPISKI